MSVPVISHEKVGKHVYLSKVAIEQIEAYIVQNGLNPKKDFSKTLEALALITLEDEVMIGHLSAIQQAVDGAVAAQYNRFAKLLAHIAIEVGAAREAAQHVYFQQIIGRKEKVEEQMEYGLALFPSYEEFEFQMSLDRNQPLDAIADALYEQRKQRFEYRSAKRLKKPFETILELIEKANDADNDR